MYVVDSRKDRYAGWSRIVDTSKSIFTDIKLHMHACLYSVTTYNDTIALIYMIRVAPTYVEPLHRTNNTVDTPCRPELIKGEPPIPKQG